MPTSKERLPDPTHCGSCQSKLKGDKHCKSPTCDWFHCEECHSDTSRDGGVIVGSKTRES